METGQQKWRKYRDNRRIYRFPLPVRGTKTYLLGIMS